MLSRIQGVKLTANTNKIFHHGFKIRALFIMCDKKIENSDCVNPNVSWLATDSGFHYLLHKFSNRIFLGLNQIKYFL